MQNVVKMNLPTQDDVAEVGSAFEKLTQGFRSNPAPTAPEREDRLDRLEQLMVRHREELVAAAHEDFGGRGRVETLVADVVLTLDSARDARRHVRRWMKPRRARTHMTFIGSSAYIERVPLGVIAILAPWNYPVNLALGPLAGALAAGNRALVKPSELTPKVSAVMAAAVREHFTAEEVCVVEGGPGVAQAVTRLPLDHLFFTGSTSVGRHVAKAAAEHLVPVTLELGGKSPVLIHPTYPVARAAERVAVGKLFNAGQTCIAPDYVLLPEGKEVVFLEAFRAQTLKLWPQGPTTSLASDRGLERMRALIEDAKAKGARVETVELPPTADRALGPVLIFNPTNEMKVMQEEIFGPLLPVVTYRTEAEALGHIESRPHPLAFYVFDEDTARAARTVRTVRCGGACINDTLAHFAQESLPFGGVGGSGIGQYHGRYGFETFSHPKGVLVSSRLSPGRSLTSPKIGKLLDSAMGFLTSRLGRFIH
jgi:coniferyl-aldehyde dehydrogenase